MKLILMSVLLMSNAMAYTCEDFMADSKKMEALEFIATNALGHESAQDFCDNGNYIDLELDFTPNFLFYKEEEDDHYRLMVHRSTSSCTIIYNSTKKHITSKRCYSTW